MSFKQISINIDSKNAEKLSDIFMKLDALSVSIEDQHENTELEQPIFNEPGMDASELWEHSKINILFTNDIETQSIINKAYILLGKTFEYSVIDIEDQDWVRLNQSQFEPIKINDNLYIVPSWHELPDKNATGIMLDPGLAFGTGSHATTFMCLDWISRNVNSTHFVIDYGCGSGILAIAAKKFKANRVYGTDIDKQAIEASKQNILKNDVDVNLYLPSQLPNVPANIVIANILSNPLRLLAPLLANLTLNKLILSGILESQIEEMSTIYAQWFKVNIANIVDGWVLLECTKHDIP